jgi:3-oxoacyl-[acyl-carrier protein] reductase
MPTRKRQTDRRSRVALVTGGSRGIGRAIAIELAAAGFDVAFAYRGFKRGADRTAAAVRAEGRRALAVRADVTQPAQVERLLRRVRGALGPIDVLVNNVGEYTEGPIASMQIEEWRGIFDSNLHSAFMCARAALPDMRRRRWGRIVNITESPAETQAPAPGAAAYHVSKLALLAFTRALALEEIRRGITVNAVGPGLTDNEHLGVKGGKEMRSLSPIGRLVRPEEIARAVAFLMAPESAAITGAQLSVGGGWDMTGGARPDASLSRVLPRR